MVDGEEVGGPKMAASISSVQKLALNRGLMSAVCVFILPFLWDCGPKLPWQPSIAVKVCFGGCMSIHSCFCAVIANVDMAIR